MFYIGVDGISKLNPYDYNSKPISVLNITKGSIILALDTLNKYVYWANSFEVRIMRVTYDGSRVMNFASMSNGAIAGFAFSAKTVFWKDTRMEGISRSLGNGAGLTTLYRGVPGCTDLYILGEWLWCTSDFGVIRLEQYGKCGGYFGPFHELNQQFKGYIFNGNLENTCQNVYINIYGVKPNEGQVSISNGIDWHPLCADGWDDADAAVACRMLGYSGEDAKATFNISVSAYSNWPFQFDCNGDESELSRCNISDSSTLDCYRAELLCSEHKVVEDFFLKRGMHDWSFTLSITNPWTMSGYINTNNPCNDIYGFYGSDVEVVYDYVTQQFLTLQSETLWGCRWSEGIREIRPNVTELRYSAVDSEDRLLFGYMGNAIVSLELDNVFSGFVIVVNKTSVGKKMILDTERNELYWWESNTCILKRICYPGCLEVVDVLSTSSTFRKFTFNGEYIFAIDSVQRGLIRINRNTSVQDKLYEAYGVMTDCTNLYANEEWIYCTGYRSLGVIRLKADGTGGSFHGPIEFSWTAYHSSVIFYHRSRSPGEHCDGFVSPDRRFINTLWIKNISKGKLSSQNKL
ncbi:uncharacterized protein [Argopecten irradians]|uniref:uncharacterized protein n=1 Tax=Argopecten irradians TaxID=31199 RepID=UPI003723EE51